MFSPQKMRKCSLKSPKGPTFLDDCPFRRQNRSTERECDKGMWGGKNGFAIGIMTCKWWKLVILLVSYFFTLILSGGGNFPTWLYLHDKGVPLFHLSVFVLLPDSEFWFAEISEWDTRTLWNIIWEELPKEMRFEIQLYCALQR